MSLSCLWVWTLHTMVLVCVLPLHSRVRFDVALCFSIDSNRFQYHMKVRLVQGMIVMLIDACSNECSFNLRPKRTGRACGWSRSLMRIVPPLSLHKTRLKNSSGKRTSTQGSERFSKHTSPTSLVCMCQSPGGNCFRSRVAVLIKKKNHRCQSLYPWRKIRPNIIGSASCSRFRFLASGGSMPS